MTTWGRLLVALVIVGLGVGVGAKESLAACCRCEACPFTEPYFCDASPSVEIECGIVCGLANCSSYTYSNTAVCTATGVCEEPIPRVAPAPVMSNGNGVLLAVALLLTGVWSLRRIALRR